ncbi:beta-catenin-like protein 1-like [Hibiscus syriacus]|uniref:Beta-catenin-like protein 1-like n=1 Tax=Hibiscus syriacus TaxID=106335 RepID=A0A6A2YVT8_HIBSY|nr:U-box domain-containing protein 44-like [Hibiscus syriacus]XP_039023570.1 U-box domain-containing protein 44-like [Hibiscus syriacus]KAE8683165.1 beta-catenin-like protein 1-like [Hibiscus syriacus]
MEKYDLRSFPELISELVASVEEVSSIAKDSEKELFIEFSSLLNKLGLILSDIKNNEDVMDTVTIRKVIKSIWKELQRVKTLIKSTDSKQPILWIDNVMQDLGRSLGLVLFASIDLHSEMKEKISALHKEFMNVRFNGSFTPSPSSGPSSRMSRPPSPCNEDEFVSATASEKEIEEEITEIEEERANLSIDDVVLQLKYGIDEDFNFALSGFNESIKQGLITNDWINEEGIILVLVNRLSSCKPNNRLIILQILRKLASQDSGNKEKMVDVASLSALVKSLTRDSEERREAVGLLLDLSDLPAVWRRLGRIQGCIVMLVTMLNGDDSIASSNARKLLNALSSNTQNALHMAEAGYFKPLVHYLKEGSDMSKILMATALSRMELTDQSRATLGEDGAVDHLVKMFNAGKLEAKLSALNALQNLSNMSENIQRLINSGIVISLLQLLFSITSVLMTLREPASAILARIAQSESILVNQDVAQQMLSLLNLSSPIIQYHLVLALNSIAGHSNASKVRRKMKENGAIQLLLPFLTESNTKIRTGALDLLYTLSRYLPEEMTEQLGESHLNIIVNIISSSPLETDKAAAVGILSNVPISNKKVTEVLKKANLLPVLISMMNSSPSTVSSTSNSLAEAVAGILIRFTVPSDKRLQLLAAQNEAIPLLVKLLSSGSLVAKCRAATALSQLSQNSVSLRKSKKSSWFCVSPSATAICEVHDRYCIVKNTFCLVKAGAIPPLVQILEGKEREADEAVLNAMATLLQDEIWENGSDCIAKNGGVEAIIKMMESASVKAQEKGLWILERVFQVEEHRVKYGESAQVVLIDLTQNGDPRLKSTTAKLLAQLELLQVQSSYF